MQKIATSFSFSPTAVEDLTSGETEFQYFRFRGEHLADALKDFLPNPDDLRMAASAVQVS